MTNEERQALEAAGVVFVSAEDFLEPKSIPVRQQSHLDFLEIVKVRRKKNEPGYRLLAGKE